MTVPTNLICKFCTKECETARGRSRHEMWCDPSRAERNAASKQKIADKLTGSTLSDETKKKMSAASKGKPKSESAKANMSAAQQNMSEETKEKLRINANNRSDEHLQKIADANRGKKRSDETLKNMAEKTRKTSIEKYGVLHPSKLQTVKDKISGQHRINTYGMQTDEEIFAFLQTTYAELLITLSRKPTRFEFQEAADLNLARTSFGGKISQLGFDDSHFHKAQNTPELDLTDYIKSLVPNATIILNSHKVIPPKELDIYLPEYNLAIEFNGIWCHSEFGFGKKDKDYHLNKTLECEKKGINLLQIWSNEWDDPNTQQIWKSVIRHKLNASTKIFARKCKVHKLTKQEAKAFFEHNHLDGSIGGDTIALLYEGEIVQAVSYGNNRFKTDHSFEIYRTASKRNHVVIGGLSKLFKYLPAGSYICYANRRYANSSACGYSNIMKRIGETGAGWYCFNKNDKATLFSRNHVMKHKLIARHSSYDTSKSALENMLDLGYDRIWDCGHLRFEMIK